MDRLDLAPRAAAPPGVVRRVERLHHHALVAGGDGALEERGRLAGVGRDDRRQPGLGRDDRRQQLAAHGQRLVDDGRAAGVEHVEEVRRQPVPAPGRRVGRRSPPSCPGTGAARPRRRRRAPRRRARGRRRAGSTTSAATAPRRPVISLRLRVKMRTCPSRRWAWIRAPSSFHSTDAGPVASSAAATSAAGDASIGCTARPGTIPTAPSASTPPVSAAVAVTPRSPANMWARRTAAIGTSAALATASTITPSSAPCRSSPLNTFHSRRCSGSVALAKTSVSSARRAALTPAPDIAASWSSGPVDLGDLQRRLRRRVDLHVAQRRPADADASLPRRPGEHADGDGDLVGRQPAQQRGEQCRLLAPLRRRRQLVGRGGQLGEAHVANGTSTRATIRVRCTYGGGGRQRRRPDEMTETTAVTVNGADTDHGDRRPPSTASSSASPATPATACSSLATASRR